MATGGADYRAERSRERLRKMVQAEQRHSAKNRQQLDEGWTKLLDQADDEAREAILAVKWSFEAEVDSLDCRIKNLVGNLDKLEPYVAKAQQSHQEQLTQVDKRLNTVHQLWDKTLHQISSRNREETDKVLSGVKEQRTRLQEFKEQSERQNQTSGEFEELQRPTNVTQLLREQERKKKTGPPATREPLVGGPAAAEQRWPLWTGGAPGRSTSGPTAVGKHSNKHDNDSRSEL